MYDKPEITINKSLLLNWLYLSQRNISLTELGNWIEAKTDGEYKLVKRTTMSQCSNNSSQLNKECA